MPTEPRAPATGLDDTSRLLEDLKSPQPETRARAARVIGNTGGMAVIEELINALGDTEPKVFIAVKEALVLLRPQSNEAVLRALDHEDNLICSGAIELVGEMNLREALPKVTEFLRSPDREIKTAVVRTLIKLDGARAVQAVAPLIEDPDPKIRLHVIKSIGSLHEGVNSGIISPRLQDADPDIRRAAIALLARVGDQNCVDDLRAVEHDPDPELAEAARTALTAIGERAVGPYIDNLTHKDVGARLAALDTLIKQGKAAVLPLIAMLEHRSSLVRGLVAEILGEIADPRALDALTQAVADRDRHVRLAAIAAIGKLKTQAAVARLLEALESDDSEFADIAAKALVNAGTVVSQHMISLLILRSPAPAPTSPTPDILPPPPAALRARAARILGQLREPLALRPLIDALKDPDDWVRTGAATALGSLLDPAATGPLITCLRDAHPSVRAAAAEAIGQLRDLSATESLLPLLQDVQASVRAAAARALGRIGDSITIEPLIGLLDSPDREVRIATIEALGNLRATKVLERLQRIAWPWPRSFEHPAVKRAARVAAVEILKAKEEDVELMKAHVESSQSTKVTYQ